MGPQLMEDVPGTSRAFWNAVSSQGTWWEPTLSKKPVSALKTLGDGAGGELKLKTLIILATGASRLSG